MGTAVQGLFVTVALLGLAPASTRAGCANDAPAALAIATTRAALLQACACCTLGSRRSVVRCAAPRLKAAVREGRLSRACAGRLMREQARTCRPTNDCAAPPTTVTSTTVPPPGCQRDADCKDDNPCTTNWCAEGHCTYACDRCALVHPNGGDTEWLCCSPPRDDCPPLPPPTTTTTTLPKPCGAGACRYYRTCGWPVCGLEREGAGVPACTSQAEGAACTQRFERCDAGFGCGAVLLCSDHDPVLRGCPISRRDAKRDIRYLDAADLDRLRDELLRLKLARWRYRSDANATPEHLGFIIDDLEQSPAVATDGSHVDLYGYASLAVAAVQAQAREIATLKREVAALRSELVRRTR